MIEIIRNSNSGGECRDSGYLAGFGDAIGEERDPNLPESYTTPLDLDRESGRMLRLAKRQNEMGCPVSQWLL